MKLFIATLLLALVCASTAGDPKDDMIKGLIAKINGWSGTVDELKADIASNIKSDPGTYSESEVKAFIDGICAGWTLSKWKCEDFRAFVMETKKAAGKISSK